VSGALAASDAQQALFDIGTDAITVTYRARYSGDAADFAWVLALPGHVTGVAEGDGDTLDEIAAESAPRVEVDPAVYDQSSGCGCGMGAASKGDAAGGDFGDTAGDTGGSRGVEVTGTGYAGAFEYTTLAASDADSLVQWLDDHGYDTALISAAVGAYVEDPLDYEFVAVQLRPDVAQTPEGGVMLTPLQITYGAAADGALHAIFPATLGKTSTVDTVNTEIFVLASGTASLSGWDAADNPDDNGDEPGDFVAPDYVDPSGVYYDGLLHLGGAARKMWLAYAGRHYTEMGERWLTRYDAVVYPATNVVDAEFTDSGEQTEASTVIYLQEESAYEEQHPYDTGLGIVAFLGALGLRRRRR
jgi:hypothetical protein